MITDRFLVQLTKLEDPPTGPVQADEIGRLWERVDKTKLIQYKLKVELGPDVTSLIKQLNESPTAGNQLADGPSLEQSMKTDLYQSVKTGVADTILNKDSRTQKPEETKINAGSL